MIVFLCQERSGFELANPNEQPNPAKAPWYFLGLQELLSYAALQVKTSPPEPCVLLPSRAALLLPSRAALHLGRKVGSLDFYRRA
jgi:hypothetical protein